jgi:hypothetical protein
LLEKHKTKYPELKQYIEHVSTSDRSIQILEDIKDPRRAHYIFKILLTGVQPASRPQAAFLACARGRKSGYQRRKVFSHSSGRNLLHHLAVQISSQFSRLGKSNSCNGRGLMIIRDAELRDARGMNGETQPSNASLVAKKFPLGRQQAPLRCQLFSRSAGSMAERTRAEPGSSDGAAESHLDGVGAGHCTSSRPPRTASTGSSALPFTSMRKGFARRC